MYQTAIVLSIVLYAFYLSRHIGWGYTAVSSVVWVPCMYWFGVLAAGFIYGGIHHGAGAMMTEVLTWSIFMFSGGIVMTIYIAWLWGTNAARILVWLLIMLPNMAYMALLPFLFVVHTIDIILLNSTITRFFSLRS